MPMNELSTLLPAFVHVPAGSTFLMGTPASELSTLARRYGGTRESYREETPQHALSLGAFAIAVTTVSSALYGAYVAATGARPPITWRAAAPPAWLLDHPVVDVSWDEANDFCVWLRQQPGGRQFRLPTEAEWERAARGTDGRTFPWGEQFDPQRANTREHVAIGTTPVDSFPDGASPVGALGMAGNVWEWTSSLDANYPYQATDGREQLAARGRRILRGGCYANPHGFARCACRFRLAPTLHNEFTGLRLAVSGAG
jgi:formylglycine-generating enzyme required for sulfatase activity